MSIADRNFLSFILIMLLCGLPGVFAGNSHAFSKSAINPFDVEIFEPVEDQDKSVLESEFCQRMRLLRDKQLNVIADLNPGGVLQTDDSSICFTADENLLLVANQEAQIILGPYAPWYLALSQENRERVREACEVMGFETDTGSKAFKTCIENRYKELMGPYENRYRRESVGYIGKRQSMARHLVQQCNAALRKKRPLLPRDLTFPIALYDRNLSSIPAWMMEEESLSNLWLKRKGGIKAKDVMQAALGAQCPGNMVLWATYKAPEGVIPDS